MRKKILSPKIYPLNRDMRKAWFVKWNDKAGKPRKLQGQMNNLHTLNERLKEGNRIIKEILLPGSTDEKRKDDLIGNLSDLLDYKKPTLEQSSYASFFSIVKLFSVWYRKARAADKTIAASDYIRHMHTLGLHKNTIRNRTIVLRFLCKELIEKGKQVHNPFDNIKLKKIKAQSKLPFYPNQIAELLPIIEVEDKQLKEAVNFCYYLFFRPKELRHLKIKHILFEAMKIIASDDVVKDDDNYLKTIPLPLQHLILKYKGLPPEYYIFSENGEPGHKILSRDNLSKRMTKILRKLNYSNRYTLYSWVHTGIKQAAMSGIPVKQLQLQKGHHDLQMFDEYLKDLGVNDCVQLANNFPALQ
ncbi:MAG: hypothetical protein JST29_05470 [Bacteroidetes bacterium]|nr:hypothetical protein [Bacteroidota bacterium]